MSLEGNIIFSPTLGLLKFQDFLNFLYILKLSYSKPFYITLNYASTANFQEVMKFYDLGNESFETDFNLAYRQLSPSHSQGICF